MDKPFPTLDLYCPNVSQMEYRNGSVEIIWDGM